MENIMKLTSIFTFLSLALMAALSAGPAEAKPSWVVKGSLNGIPFVFYEQDGKYMKSKGVCEKARKEIVAYYRAQGNKTKLNCILTSTPGKL
jgi:hypothetical protein